MHRKKYILPVIVLAQFCCTSLWFAGNGVMGDLVSNFGLAQSALGHLTSAVQLGFISGTLVFAILTIADRYSPSKVFAGSALLGAAFNMGLMWSGNTLGTMLAGRFLTGFFLAGIYPVGMKIAADHFERQLGQSLGFLVGALVVGTAFPHLLKGISAGIPWRAILGATSGLAVAGGLLMVAWVPDGPYRQAGQRMDFSACMRVFREAEFRSAAFGYFGHMWELYTFWAFVPVMLQTYVARHPATSLNVPVISFLVIGLGGAACVLGGFLSQKLGVKRTAFGALALSGLCCLVSPVAFELPVAWGFVGFLIFWGLVVIADSPLFSTLVAQSAAPAIKGTALTIVNSIGFAITIVSIQWINALRNWTDSDAIYLFLAIGPALGLWALSRGGRGEKAPQR
ncbi:MAG: MFS transporter [Bacteroidetes bacterium]|nr:MAG: MFS transporter [Bacteroidota bacterium]